MRDSRLSINWLSAGVGRKVVPYVVSVLRVVMPLLVVAAVVRDCAWRVLASQEHVVIVIRIPIPTSYWGQSLRFTARSYR